MNEIIKPCNLNHVDKIYTLKEIVQLKEFQGYSVCEINGSRRKFLGDCDRYKIIGTIEDIYYRDIINSVEDITKREGIVLIEMVEPIKK